ncbi:M23 family metallopeptidase [Streptomyces sp. NPDC020898]|uniref:M23 family metallopeptidase n=1 Tax=Streptomyces sp. NPDC020898 TaxID=3365101 RepID=UPI0037BE0B66
MTTLYTPFRGSFRIIRGFTGSDYTRHHTGVDFGTPRNTPILVSAAGTVVHSVDLERSYGHHIIVSHGGGLFTLYAHLETRLAGKGAKVTAGQRIGLSGSTGNSSGPHLHFEVRRGRNGSGATVDPLRLLKGNPPVAAFFTGLEDLEELNEAEELGKLEEIGQQDADGLEESAPGVCCGEPDVVAGPVEG